MQPTVFHYDPPKERTTYLLLVVCSLALGLISLGHFRSDYSESGSIFWSWPFLVMAIWFFGFATLSLLKIAGIGFLARKWNRVHLSLDDDGLTYVRAGALSPRRWSWTELSEFEYRGRSFLRGSSILFGWDAPRLMDRILMEGTASGPRYGLPDIFDAAPKEIVAKLNEYRDRALANPGAGGAQSTPAGRDQP